MRFPLLAVASFHLSATDHRPDRPSSRDRTRQLAWRSSKCAASMPELSDEERLLLVDRVDELRLNGDQKMILSDKAMNCQRNDADFKKLKMLGTFWRRYRCGAKQELVRACA